MMWNQWGDAVLRTDDDTFFAKATCTVAWQCIGLWEDSDGGEVTSTHVDPVTDVLVCGDQYGRLKLYTYPVLEKGNLHLAFRGHAGTVSTVRFSGGGHHVYSLGKTDCCIFQYKHELDKMELSDDEEEQEQEQVVEPRKGSTDYDKENEAAVGNSDPLLLDELHAADTLITKSSQSSIPKQEERIKDYLSMIAEPSDFRLKDEALGSTDCDLELQWVHGYRSQDCRNTLSYSSNGSIVYNCAALGVCYNKSTDTQHFQQGTHTDDILSLAIHPDGNICATGQVGDVPKIVVWDVVTQQTKALISGFHRLGVGLLQFDSTGKLLLSVGLDDLNSLAIYAWEQSKCIATAVVSKAKVMAACFVGTKVVTGGNGFLKFWTLSGNDFSCQNGILKKSVGISAKRDFFVVCAAPLDDSVSLTTGVNGEMVLWNGCEAMDSRERISCNLFKHEGSINAIFSNIQTNEVVTADKNGVVALWSWSVENPLVKDEVKEVRKLWVVKVFKLEDLENGDFSFSNHNIRSVCMMNSDEMLVGTGGSEIIEVKTQQIPNYSDFNEAIDWPKDIGFNVINEGHYAGELWGLAVHPGKDLFVTGGDDKVVRLWNTTSKNCVAKRTLEWKCRALVYSPCGSWNQDRPHLACGMNNGRVIIIDGELGNDNTLACLTEPTQWIQEMAYTFESSRLAVGCHDNVIYVYDVQNAYAFVGKIDTFTSFITQIDFGILLKKEEQMNQKGVVVDLKGKRVRNVEVSEVWMQCCSGDDKISFFNVKTLEEEKSASKLKDLIFATYSQTLGFPVQGIVGKGKSKVNSVDRNHMWRKVPVLATSDELGVIRLYNYPCIHEGAAEKTFLGHSAAVTNIRFTFDDGCLVSVGGSDRTICVWKTDIIEEARELDAAGMNGDDESVTSSVFLDGDEEADDDSEDTLFDDVAGVGRSGGDEFMAVRPYLGAIREPSTWKEPEVRRGRRV